MDFSKTIIIKKKGKSYTAVFSHDSGVVTVTAKGPDGTIPMRSTRATGPDKAETMAKGLLREMIEAGRVIPD